MLAEILLELYNAPEHMALNAGALLTLAILTPGWDGIYYAVTAVLLADVDMRRAQYLADFAIDRALVRAAQVFWNLFNAVKVGERGDLEAAMGDEGVESIRNGLDALDDELLDYERLSEALVRAAALHEAGRRRQMQEADGKIGNIEDTTERKLEILEVRTDDLPDETQHNSQIPVAGGGALKSEEMIHLKETLVAKDLSEQRDGRAQEAVALAENRTETSRRRDSSAPAAGDNTEDVRKSIEPREEASNGWPSEQHSSQAQEVLRPTEDKWDEIWLDELPDRDPSE